MPNIPNPDSRPVPIRQEQQPKPVPPTRPIGRRAEQLGGNRPKLSIVRNEPPVAHAAIRPVFESGASVKFGGGDWMLLEDDGVISTIRGADERGRVVDRQVVTKDLLAYGNRPTSMMQDRPDGVGGRAVQGSESPTVRSSQRQQGEQRVPFGDRFPAGVEASFDSQRWVSTGMKDDIGQLLFRPVGGGDIKAIDAYMLQVKGAFPLEPETQAGEAAGKAYHVRPGQDVYVLRSSGKIERGWKVEYIDGKTGKVTIKTPDGNGGSLKRDDPREFIDDLNRPTVPEDIGAINFDKCRTALERREKVLHAVRRLKAGGLQGSKGFSANDKLVEELQFLFDRPSQDGINLLTNTGGLRDKVRELLNKELTEQRSRGNS